MTTIIRKTFPERLAERADAWAEIATAESEEPAVALRAEQRIMKSAEKSGAWMKSVVEILFAFIRSTRYVTLSHKGRILEIYNELEALRESSGGWKGVWSPVASYQKGQTTTQGGSLWHCNKSGTTEKPGKSDDWSLMVKSNDNR